MKSNLRPRFRPLLVTHKGFSALISVSLASLYRRLAAGEIGPAPLSLGGRRLFKVAEIRRWVNAGLPNRETWVAMENERKAKR